MENDSTDRERARLRHPSQQRPDFLTPEQRVGRRVRLLREFEGWNQTEVSRRMAAYGFTMHQTTVAKLENGTRPIRLNEVAALAQVFGIELDELLAPLYPEVEEAVAGDLLRRAHEQLQAAYQEVNDATAAYKEAEARFHQAHADYTAAQMWLEECEHRHQQHQQAQPDMEDEDDGERQQEA